MFIERLPEFVGNHPLLVMGFVVVAVLLIGTTMRAGGKSIAPALVGSLVNREGAVLVDVRPDADFRAGRIAGSVGIPLSQLSARTEELRKHQGKPLVLVCDVGNSAGEAARQLIKAGFAPVYVLAGGLSAWRGENLPVVKG